MNLSTLSWQHALLALFAALTIVAALILVLSEVFERRRSAKAFRINPMYRVGEDAKDLT
jgi:hypothetical protein